MWPAHRFKAAPSRARLRLQIQSRNPCEPGLKPAFELDVLKEHGVRAHPQARRVVQRAIQHQGFERFAVACRADHLVLATPVVAIQAQRRVGQFRQVTHLGAQIMWEFVDK